MNELIVVTLISSLLGIISILLGLYFNMVLTRKKRAKENEKKVEEITKRSLNQINLQMRRTPVFNYECDSVSDVRDIMHKLKTREIGTVRLTESKAMKYIAYEISPKKPKKKAKKDSIKAFEQYKFEKECRAV